MSFPFESRAHAALRRRLLAAMGLLSGCVGEAPVGSDAGREEPSPLTANDDLPEDAAPTREVTSTRRDAVAMDPTLSPSPPPPIWALFDAGSIVTDASAAGADGGRLRCVNDLWHQTQCFTRPELFAVVRNRFPLRSPNPRLQSDAEIEAALLPNGCLPKQHVAESCCNVAGVEAVVDADGKCCYEFCVAACCGRPFLVEGRARVARAMRRTDWISGLPELLGRPLPMPLRERAAAEWLEDARMEHASVAAFARFTLELLAFGAPAELVGESHLAGLDEIEHARMCFALASRYAGAELGPAPLSMSDVAPAQTLRDSVLSAVREGCIGETLAAARASAALEGARDQATRTVLAKIAEDETRHAELAYRYVAWALTREPTLAADIEELARREARSSAPFPTKLDRQMDVLEPALTLLGRLSPARAQSTQHGTFTHVILPCIDSLLRRHAEALSPLGARVLA